MTRRKLRRTLLAGAGALALAGPAAAQDVTTRLEALERQVRAQQLVIQEQAAAIRELTRQAEVPEALPGSPVTPAEVFQAPAGNVLADERTSETGVQTLNAGATRAQAPPDAVITGGAAEPSTGVDTLGTGLRRALEASRLLATADLERPRVLIAGGRPTIVSADGRYSLSLRGIAQADVAVFRQDEPQSPPLEHRRGSIGAGGRETSAAADLSNGANFRRARLGVEGVLDRDFGYRLMFEFGGSGTEGPARINDAWLSYTGFAPFTLQAGAFSPPANMDDGQSPEDQLFLERASAAELSRTLAGADGRMGVGVRAATPRLFGALTVTGSTVNDAEASDEQLGVVGRAAVLALSEPVDNRYNVQFGVNGSLVSSLADQGAAAGVRYPVRLRDRPELRVDGTRLVDTGPIDADQVRVFGLEGGAQYRNLHLQAEHFWFDLERRNSTFTDPSFKGGYVQGSWILTGEFRRHNMATASFQNPRPYAAFSPRAGGFGAFELAARYSFLDLNENAGAPGTAAAPGSVRGGEQRILTVGMNWYLNSNAKVLLNYQHVEVDRLNPAGPGALTPFGPAPATPPAGVQIGQEYDAVALRTQFAF